MPFLKLKRIFARYAPEYFVEVGQALEPAGEAGFGYVLVAQKQFLGLIDAELIDKLGKRHPGYALEIVAERGRRQIAQGSYLANVDFARVIFFDELIDPPEPLLLLDIVQKKPLTF